MSGARVPGPLPGAKGSFFRQLRAGASLRGPGKGKLRKLRGAVSGLFGPPHLRASAGVAEEDLGERRSLRSGILVAGPLSFAGGSGGKRFGRGRRMEQTALS